MNMSIEDIAKIIEAEASTLPYIGKLAVSQCIYDNNCNQSAFTSPADYYTKDSMDAAKAVFQNGERRFPDKKILQFRSFSKYSDGNCNPDWEKLKSGKCPIPDDLEYLGEDHINSKWGHFYFGKDANDKMGNFKLLLIAGHGDGDPGACGCGYQEANLTRELVGLISIAARNVGISCDVADTSRNMYKYLKNGGSYDFKPYNYVFEVHFNHKATAGDSAANGSVSGSMFFVHPSEMSHHAVEDSILKALYDIGSKKAWDGVVNSYACYSGGLLVQNAVEKQGTPHALLETCFISDPDDMSWYQKRKNDIAAQIVAGIVYGFKLSGNTPEPAFSPYMVKVDVSAISDHFLNIREKPSADSKITGRITETMSLTIIDESNGWGKLKSGAGWINLSYTKK